MKRVSGFATAMLSVFLPLIGLSSVASNFSWLSSTAAASTSSDHNVSIQEDSSIQLASHDNGLRHSVLERFPSWGLFINRIESFADNDIHLVDVEVFRENNQTYFAGVWELGGGESLMYRYDSWTTFTQRWRDLAEQNFRLVDIEIDQVGDSTYYTGVWRPGSDGYALYVYNSWSAFTERWDELANDNYRLIDLETYRQGNNTYYAGVWRSGSDGYALYRYPSWERFTEQWSDLAGNGGNLRLVDVEVFPEGNSTYYAGVWRPGNSGYALYRYTSWAALSEKWDELDDEAYKLIDIDVALIGDRTYYTGVWQR